LRVQTRAEVARIQRDLAVTTIYVTHDQTEAMTLGDRVAVLRKGKLQQVAPSEELYARPANLFVAGFIGSPAMNIVEADLVRRDGGYVAEFGGVRLALDAAVTGERSGLPAFEGRRVIVGIRPEDMDDVSLVSGTPNGRRISTTVDLREALGSEVLVHFTVQAPPVVTEDTRELAADVGTEALTSLERRDATSTFVARLDPSTKAREGESVELVIDTSRAHFFDPETGLGIYGDDRA
ncbi:MAG: ABC transporter ATP-binding protein, partial [Actinomycetota bacterium]